MVWDEMIKNLHKKYTGQLKIIPTAEVYMSFPVLSKTIRVFLWKDQGYSILDEFEE